MPVAEATAPMISSTRDSLPGRGYEQISFTNRRIDRSISGVVSRKSKFDGYCLNLRASDLTEAQVKAVFKALGVAPPQL